METITQKAETIEELQMIRRKIAELEKKLPLRTAAYEYLSDIITKLDNDICDLEYGP